MTQTELAYNADLALAAACLFTSHPSILSAELEANCSSVPSTFSPAGYASFVVVYFDSNEAFFSKDVTFDEEDAQVTVS